MNIAIAVQNAEQMRVAGILAQALSGVSFENMCILLSEQSQELVHLAHDIALKRDLETEKTSIIDLLIYLTPTAISTIKTTASRRAIYFGSTIKSEIVLHKSDICFASEAASAEKLKNIGSEHVHVIGPLEVEGLPHQTDVDVVNKQISRFRDPAHFGYELAALRMAEIIKHTLSPEPGT